MTGHFQTRSGVATRRSVLRRGLAAGGAALAAPAIATAQGQTTTWRVQTAWTGGAGLSTFNDWCASIAEKTGGQLAFEPSDPSTGVGGFDIYDAVADGQIEAGNVFTIYSDRLFPAGVFLSSYPMAMRTASEWVGSSRVDLQACKLEYSIVSPK